MKDEAGLVLTEYLLLLGLLAFGALVSVQAVGQKIGTGFASWSVLYESLQALVPAGSAKAAKLKPCQNGIDNGNAERSNCGGNR